MKTLQLLGAVCAVVAIAACGDSGSPTSAPSPSAVTQATPGSDTSANPPVTSNGPVANVVVAPHSLTLGLGHYFTMSIFSFDAKGVRVMGKLASWRSADASIAVTSDTGLVYGKALGTTKVYGTVDGHTDSVNVTVVNSPAPPPPPSPTPGVASFDLTVIVSGAVLTGTDTTHVVRIPGATVKLTRVGGINGDTLSTSIPAGSGTTDANGNVSFKSLTGGSYTVDINPPTGSPYAPIKSGFYRPTTTDVHMSFTLQKI
jgi:hypothetical protein